MKTERIKMNKCYSLIPHCWKIPKPDWSECADSCSISSESSDDRIVHNNNSWTCTEDALHSFNMRDKQEGRKGANMALIIGNLRCLSLQHG